MAHSEKGNTVLTEEELATAKKKAYALITGDEFTDDYMASHLEQYSAEVMRRLGRDVQDPIDIVIAAVSPSKRFITAVTAPELEEFSVTYPKALRAADYVHKRPDFDGGGVAESYTYEMLEMLAELHDAFEAHKALLRELPTAPAWNWTRQLVRHALHSNSPAILVLRGEG